MYEKLRINRWVLNLFIINILLLRNNNVYLYVNVDFDNMFSLQFRNEIFLIQIMDNVEINNIIKIMGLQFKEKYNDLDILKNLRYGKLMIMIDQDQDGFYIKGFFINFMYYFWFNFLKYNVIEEFIIFIVKVQDICIVIVMCM